MFVCYFYKIKYFKGKYWVDEGSQRSLVYRPYLREGP